MKPSPYSVEQRPTQLTGLAVRRAHETAGVTKTQLAEWLNISRPRLNRLESDRPTRPGLLERALEALKQRGPVPSSKPLDRSIKGARCAPDWLVLMLALADERPPEAKAVKGLISTIQALLDMPTDGPSFTDIPTSGQLFDVRVAAIARETPDWLQEVLKWLNESAAAQAHPLFKNVETRLINVMQEIQNKKRPSQAFGLTKRGRPAGKVKGRIYRPKQFTEKEDAVRLAYLLILNGANEYQAVCEAAFTCYGSGGTVRLLQRQFTQAKLAMSPLVQDGICIRNHHGTYDGSMMAPANDAMLSAEINDEIFAIRQKYIGT